MMERISELLPSGVLAETFTRESHSIRVSYANSQFEDISNSRQQAATLRVIKDGRISIAQSSKPGSGGNWCQTLWGQWPSAAKSTTSGRAPPR